MSRTDVICDHSKEKLTKTPKEVLKMANLKMLFLEGNFISSLPEDIFWKLPRLMWLDLRNNLLEEIPKSIAFHEHLENLLLTNNNLQKLPNELGLVPKLKALQVSENPLVYPNRKIIVEGTKAIKNYLKERYEASRPSNNAPDNETNLNKQDTVCSQNDLKNDSEKLISIIEDSSSGNEVNQISPKVSRKPSKSRSIKQCSTEKMRKTLADPRKLEPTLQVQKIENHGVYKRQSEQPTMKIVHKVNKTNSKISLKSYFNRMGIRTSSNKAKVEDNNLRMGWLNQLRILLNDQEKILQQERNLKALSEWRWKQKESSPKVFRDRSIISKSEPPYAVYPEYSRIPSREELAEQLNNFFEEKGIVVSRRSKESGVNIDKLINDLMQQLKEMETFNEDGNVIDQTGQQIKTLMGIQKKLLQLKASSLT